MHNDCFKENFVLAIQDIKKTIVATVFTDDINLKKKNFSKSESIETEDLIEMQFYHPISNYKFIKILKNNLLKDSNEERTRYTLEFKDTNLLFDVGCLVVPLNFFRLSVKLIGFDCKEVK